MNKLNILLTLLICFILLGCSTSPKYEKIEIKETSVIYQTVPEDLTEPCLPSNRPPSSEEYISLKPHERETSLRQYSVTLMGDLKNCNIKLEKIRNLPKPDK